MTLAMGWNGHCGWPAQDLASVLSNARTSDRPLLRVVPPSTIAAPRRVLTKGRGVDSSPESGC
jgi:hypothetical protein